MKLTRCSLDRRDLALIAVGLAFAAITVLSLLTVPQP